MKTRLSIAARKIWRRVTRTLDAGGAFTPVTRADLIAAAVWSHAERTLTVAPNINTRNKRCSAMLRRLPWLRRFTLPTPDGTIELADRQQQAWVYTGIAGEVAEVEYASPAFTIERQNVGTISIARLNAGTKSIARQNIGTLEVGR